MYKSFYKVVSLFLFHYSIYSFSVNGALYYYTAGETDPGSGLVMMDNLACTGAETSLGECEFNGWTVSNCFHTEDVGVACRANGQFKHQTCFLKLLLTNIF